MLSETIRARLAERFAEPLPEFHKRRIVFWHDEDCEFADDVDSLVPNGVKLVKLTGTNNFAAKKLLAVDDIESDFLVYVPFAYEKPQDNWLLDIENYSKPEFRADLVSLQMEELNIAVELKSTVRQYSKFFESKERRAKLRKIGGSYSNARQLEIDIMSVLCGLTSGTMQDVIIAVLSESLEIEDNAYIANIVKFGNAGRFWDAIRYYVGYEHSVENSLSDLAAHILLTAMSQSLNLSIYLSFADWRDTFLTHAVRIAFSFRASGSVRTNVQTCLKSAAPLKWNYGLASGLKKLKQMRWLTAMCSPQLTSVF
jgi:hypothetical protein